MKVYVLHHGTTYVTMVGVYAVRLTARLAALDEFPGVTGVSWFWGPYGIEQGAVEYADGDSRLFTITEADMR